MGTGQFRLWLNGDSIAHPLPDRRQRVGGGGEAGDRMQAAGLFIGVLILSCLSGCFQPDQPATPVVLGELPRQSVNRDPEWRLARRVPGGVPKVISLDMPAAGSAARQHAALRLGVLTHDAEGKGVQVEVRVGNKQVASFQSTDPLAWTDRKIALGDPDLPEGPCMVTLRSARDYYVGPCEMVPASATPPNVLILLVDAMRADHLGCYGYARKTSPNLDALAADAVVCEEVIAQSSWTRPSVASLLTGCYPSTHGAVDRQCVMRPNMPSIEQSLGGAGYESHCLMTNPLCLPMWGIGADFDRFVMLSGKTTEKIDDRAVVDSVLDSAQRAAGRPWFVYAHLMGTHNPYDPPSPFDRQFQSETPAAGAPDGDRQKLVDAYDGEIACTDAQLGRLFDTLRRLGVYDNTLIAVMADHGEQFYEHGVWGHGQSLYNEEVRIPLILKLPASRHAGLRYGGLAEEVDIAPTILEVVGAPAQPRFQGRSLLPAIEGRGPERERAYASLHLEAKSMCMAQSREAKYICDMATNQKMWFDLKQDPGEQHALTHPIPEVGGLEEYAARATSLGSEGLNILITPGNGQTGVMTGSVHAKGLADGSIDYHARCCDLHIGDGAANFTVDFGRGRKFAGGADQWFDAVEQDSAHLRMNVGPDADVSLQLEVDGTPVSPSDVFLVGDDGNRPMEKIPFKPASLGADSRTLDPVLLPRRFAAYVWYVPPVSQIGDSELSPEIRESLHGLGYIK